MQSIIPKVKCAGSSLMLWSCFSEAGTEGLVRVEEKLNAPKYWDSLNENLVQSIQNLKLGRRFTFQQDHDPKHTARVAYDNSVNVLEWPSQSLSLNPIKYFWRNLKMCICPHPTWQSLRGEEMRRRIADNCQMLMNKACRIKQKKTWGCKGASDKYWVKGLNTYAMYLFLFFYFEVVTVLFLLCHYGVWSVDWCGNFFITSSLT